MFVFAREPPHLPSLTAAVDDDALFADDADEARPIEPFHHLDLEFVKKEERHGDDSIEQRCELATLASLVPSSNATPAPARAASLFAPAFGCRAPVQPPRSPHDDQHSAANDRATRASPDVAAPRATTSVNQALCPKPASAFKQPSTKRSRRNVSGTADGAVAAAEQRATSLAPPPRNDLAALTEFIDALASDCTDVTFDVAVVLHVELPQRSTAVADGLAQATACARGVSKQQLRLVSLCVAATCNEQSSSTDDTQPQQQQSSPATFFVGESAATDVAQVLRALLHSALVCAPRARVFTVDLKLLLIVLRNHLDNTGDERGAVAWLESLCGVNAHTDVLARVEALLRHDGSSSVHAVQSAASASACAVLTDVLMLAWLLGVSLSYPLASSVPAAPAVLLHALHSLAAECSSVRDSSAPPFALAHQQPMTADVLGPETYCVNAARACLQLGRTLAEQLQHQRANAELCHRTLPLDTLLVPLLAWMERDGVGVRAELLNTRADALAPVLAALQEHASNLCGYTFNLKSSKQLAVALYDELHLERQIPMRLRRLLGSANNRTTDAAALRLLATHAAHALPRVALEYRRLKTADTFQRELSSRAVRFGRAPGWRIEPCWIQLGIVTGRLATADPSVQNLPLPRTTATAGDDGDGELRELDAATSALLSSVAACVGVRDAVVPLGGDDFVFLSADYCQLELRVVAALSGDVQLCAMLRDTANDPFEHISRACWGTATAAQRALAKKATYALLYGASASNVGNDETDGATVLRVLAERFPSLFSFQSRIIAEARATGTIETAFWRRRRSLNDINAVDVAHRRACERTAFNFLVQGSAADVVKTAMLRVAGRLRAGGFSNSAIRVQIHDELVVECARADLSAIVTLVRDACEHAVPSLRVPLPVRLAFGPSLGELQRWTEG